MPQGRPTAGGKLDITPSSGERKPPAGGVGTYKPMDNEKTGTFEVHFRCEAGHEQTLTYKGFTREWVEFNIGLLTGDPSCYRFSPGDDSTIGKCSYPACGRKVAAEIKEIDAT